MNDVFYTVFNCLYVKTDFIIWLSFSEKVPILAQMITSLLQYKYMNYV